MSKAYKRLSPTAQFEADIQRSKAGATPRYQKMMHKLSKKIAIVLVKAASRKVSNEAKGGAECHALGKHAVSQSSEFTVVEDKDPTMDEFIKFIESERESGNPRAQPLSPKESSRQWDRRINSAKRMVQRVRRKENALIQGREP